MESATDAAKRLYKIEQSGDDIDWHKQWIEKAAAIIEARDNEWLAIVGEASITREPTLRQRYAMAALTAISNDPFYTNRSDPTEETSKMIAKEAFTIADAMIAQEAKE